MPDVVLLVLDLTGIAVFAATGALVAVRLRLDVFGAIVLGAITGLGGGILRDLLIGAVPPLALVDWRYLVVPVVAAVVTFFAHPVVGRVERPIAVLDAVGLALFCVTGAVTAHDAGLGVLASALCGLVTAIGGGMMRDVLADRLPIIFREELYATPAFAGALIAVLAAEQGLGTWTYGVAAGIALVWRLLAYWRGWRAPLPPGVGRD